MPFKKNCQSSSNRYRVSSSAILPETKICLYGTDHIRVHVEKFWQADGERWLFRQCMFDCQVTSTRQTHLGAPLLLASAGECELHAQSLVETGHHSFCNF